MKNLFSDSFYKWLAMTFVYIIAFHAIDYIFGNSTSISFFESGFISFVTLWCEQQDKIKREGK